MANKKELTDSEVLKRVASSKKWVVVLSNRAEIHEGLLGRLITTLPFDDKEIADLICRCVNSHDILRAQIPKTTPEVVIEVLGGVVELTTKSTGVQVTIQDHDNATEDEEYSEQIFDESEKI